MYDRKSNISVILETISVMQSDKMDGKQVIFGICIISTLIIILLAFGSYQYFHQTCVLVMDAEKLVSDGRSRLEGASPIRSSDKSLLIKLSAHLDYYPPPLPPIQMSQDWSEFGPLLNMSASNIGTNNQLGAQPSGLIDSAPRQVVQQVPAETPSSLSLVNEEKSMSSNGPQVQPSEATKRYLPLSLSEVKHSKNDASSHTYVLIFDCAKLNIIFRSLSGRIFVESMSLDLDVPNKNMTTCDVYIPRGEAFSTVLQGASNQAHYSCDKRNILIFRCHHKGTSEQWNPNTMNDSTLVALLQIHLLEFQISSSLKAPQAKVFRSTQISNCA